MDLSGAQASAVESSLGELAQLTRPVSLAAEQALPVLPALETVLPQRGLQRGSTVSIQGGPGTCSLALALAAGASGAGSWVAVAGVPALGVAAAAELGVVLERMVMVASPPASLWPTVAAALIDSFDVVLIDWAGASEAMARRLAARARERKAVVIPIASSRREHTWNEAADIRLTVRSARWEGLGRGHGRLSARRVEVQTGGRRSPRTYETSLWLPDTRGGVSVAEDTPLARPIPFPVPGTQTASLAHR